MGVCRLREEYRAERLSVGRSPIFMARTKDRTVLAQTWVCLRGVFLKSETMNYHASNDKRICQVAAPKQSKQTKHEKKETLRYQS